MPSLVTDLGAPNGLPPSTSASPRLPNHWPQAAIILSCSSLVVPDLPPRYIKTNLPIRPSLIINLIRCCGLPENGPAKYQSRLTGPLPGCSNAPCLGGAEKLDLPLPKL